MELTDGCYSGGDSQGCQGLFTPVSLGYPLSVFNKNSTLKGVASVMSLGYLLSVFNKNSTLKKTESVPPSAFCGPIFYIHFRVLITRASLLYHVRTRCSSRNFSSTTHPSQPTYTSNSELQKNKNQKPKKQETNKEKNEKNKKINKLNKTQSTKQRHTIYILSVVW